MSPGRVTSSFHVNNVPILQNENKYVEATVSDLAAWSEKV